MKTRKKLNETFGRPQELDLSKIRGGDGGPIDKDEVKVPPKQKK